MLWSGFRTRWVAPGQWVSSLIQFDKRCIRDVTMLPEAVAHRQFRFECQLQRPSIERLHGFDSVGEEADIDLRSVELYERASRSNDPRPF
jgi:hypothetical protein